MGKFRAVLEYVGAFVVMGVTIDLLPESAENAAVGVELLALVGLRVWERKRKKKKAAKTTARQAAPVRPTAPVPMAAPTPRETAQEQAEREARRKARFAAAKEMDFKLAGVTFEGRQNYLRKIAEYEEPFDGCGYGLRETEWKGEVAYDIVAELDNGTEKVLGKVPADMVAKVQAVADRVFYVDVEVYGGDVGKNYGARATLTYDP